MKTLLLPLIISIFFLNSCSYYKAGTVSKPQPNRVSELIEMDKTMVVHYGPQAFIIDNIKISNDSLGGKLVSSYKYPKGKSDFPEAYRNRTYRKKFGEERLLDEVHIYLPGSYKVEEFLKLSTRIDVNYLFSLVDINRLDIYTHNGLQTVFVRFISIVAGLFGGLVLYSIIFV